MHANAYAHSCAMNARFRGRVLAFSFARAIQQPTLEIGGGHEDKVDWAQHALSYRAKCDRAARRGNFPAALEGE